MARERGGPTSGARAPVPAVELPLSFEGYYGEGGIVFRSTGPELAEWSRAWPERKAETPPPVRPPPGTVERREKMNITIFFVRGEKRINLVY